MRASRAHVVGSSRRTRRVSVRVRYLLERVWDDAAQLGRIRVSLHRVRLSGTRLAVDEHCRVETVEGRFDGRRGRFVVHLLLSAVGAEHMVEREVLRRLTLVALRVLNDDARRLVVRPCVRLVPILLLLARERPDPHHHFHAFALPVRHTRGPRVGLVICASLCESSCFVVLCRHH